MWRHAASKNISKIWRNNENAKHQKRGGVSKRKKKKKKSGVMWL